MSVRSGPTWTDAFAHYDPDTSSWRTSQLSLELNSGESPTPWPRSGIALRGCASPLPPWERRTGVSGSSASLLPTPKTSDTNGPGTHGDGGLDLRTVAALLPTPDATHGRKTTRTGLLLPGVAELLLRPALSSPASTGPAIPSPSAGGKPSSDDLHPPLPFAGPGAGES
ncbi:hypothetical protein SAMN05421854_102500 [Amycolatopsis rubida]|uniref:Uncharacterized protein n=1 Tax=Amycolatopsis rubida TaxID=112413 RepID=A0A1I5IIV9_9PSEU|nr:hypothetical protein SAMN05421854_102500 [Amycolatopsis rubida]